MEEGFQEAPRREKPSAKARSKAAIGKVREQKLKAEEKAKQKSQELKETKQALKAAESELSNTRDRFRKFRSRNPGHKLTQQFKEVCKFGGHAVK